MRASARSFWVALAVGLSPACSDPAQIGYDTPELPDASAAAAVAGADECALRSTYGTPACDECLVQQCCAEVAACSADAACGLALQCASRCIGSPDPTECLFACFEGGNPPEAFSSLDDCSFASCESTCFE